MLHAVDREAQLSAPRQSVRTWSMDLGIVTVAVTIAVVVLFRLWTEPLRVPFVYGGDTGLYARDAYSIIQHGWVQKTSRLGAPFGQTMYDFAEGGDNGNFLIMKVMSWFTGDWALILNAFYVLSFYTTAWSAYVVLRWLRSSRLPAVVASLLFSLSPYHLWRVQHLLLSSYFAIPIAVLLAVRSSSGQGLAWAADGRRRAMPIIAWLAACAVCASTGAYYAAFAICSIAFLSVAGAFVHRTLRPVLAGAGYIAVTMGVFVLNISGTILFKIRHGNDAIVGRRLPIEFDLYALRPIQLITPVPGHVWSFFAHVSTDLLQATNSEPSQYLGTAASIGLISLLGWTVVRSIRPTSALTPSVPALLGALCVFWLTVAVSGGFEWLLELVDFRNIRSWNRVSILLMFAALAASAIAVSARSERHIQQGGWRRAAAIAIATAITIVGVIDQRGNLTPDSRDSSAAFLADRSYFSGIEATMPPDGMIFQLPYRRFPEELPTNNSWDYDLLLPYLHTRTLRWSYGGMKGRESEWQQQLVGLPASELVSDVVSVGYSGLLVDRAGYTDNAAAFEADLRQLLPDPPPVVSPNGRWAFYDLEHTNGAFGDPATLRARAQTLLNHPRFDLQRCLPTETEPDIGDYQWCVDAATFIIDDPAPQLDSHQLQLTVQTDGPTAIAKLRVNGRQVSETPVGPDTTALTIAIPKQKRSTIDIGVRTAAGRDVRFRIVNPITTDGTAGTAAAPAPS